MNNEKAFEQILDTDEKIIETFKPNKIRTVLLQPIGISIFLAVFLIPGILMLCGGNTEDIFPAILIIGFSSLFILISFLVCFVRYGKTMFCYTNKRIIIRTGFIGVDFEAIDFDMIGAMNVRVDFLDKLVRPNTGSIAFASSASPMIQPNQAGARAGFAFMHINNPYEVYKRIKEFSSKNKDGKINS